MKSSGLSISDVPYDLDTKKGRDGLLLYDSRDLVQNLEHILLSAILGAAWKQGQDLDPPSLIQQILSPPVTRIGVLDLGSFHPFSGSDARACPLSCILLLACAARLAEMGCGRGCTWVTVIPVPAAAPDFLGSSRKSLMA